jgi:hypothetical protein
MNQKIFKINQHIQKSGTGDSGYNYVKQKIIRLIFCNSGINRMFDYILHCDKKADGYANPVSINRKTADTK